ncbi:hypothetical protein PTTG_07631 [Puccinia triticina 1-1 BBBD Race 1]|uniref:Uncharacterized protein n=1 Tax=Puccinia triticina (isolate 1-1 / race 1 (BBBD)) TaxID=630390 RepID=A0A0C4F3F2_PUCT1|nr:hypothetical protein PTTG_07631 [Puccinia triticina 1-1 BBBD Race 1]WAR63608.1 hypothetical protein PtB15_17B208 [Puccinia triticina]
MFALLTRERPIMQAEGLGTFSAVIMHPDDSDAVQTEEKIWDLTMRVNCKGVWWGCKYGIQAMLANPVDESKGLKPGRSIINTASFVAKLGAATPQLACAH